MRSMPAPVYNVDALVGQFFHPSNAFTREMLSPEQSFHPRNPFTPGLKASPGFQILMVKKDNSASIFNSAFNLKPTLVSIEPAPSLRLGRRGGASRAKEAAQGREGCTTTIVYRYPDL